MHLPVCILAVSHRVDVQDVSRFLCKADAVIADPEAEFTRCSLESLDVAFPAFRKASERTENSHGGFTIQRTNLCPSTFRPGNFLHT